MNHEGLDEAVEEGKVTKLLTSDPQTVQLEAGQLPVQTEYVWIHNDDDYGDTLCDAKSRRLIWSC